jgi:hypothetical protein
MLILMKGRCIMFYAALAFFGAAFLMTCLDAAGVRFAHGGGPAATVLAMMGVATLAAKAIALRWSHEP